MLPISKVVQEEDIILQDTGFDLHFNQEKFELPKKDSWRFSEIEEIELPLDLKKDLVEPFKDPPLNVFQSKECIPCTGGALDVKNILVKEISFTSFFSV